MFILVNLFIHAVDLTENLFSRTCGHRSKKNMGADFEKLFGMVRKIALCIT